MIRAIPSWEYSGEAPFVAVSAAGDGAALVVDAKNRLTLLSPQGEPVWALAVGEPVRSARVANDGRGAWILTATSFFRLGATGKELWRVASPPFALDLAVRRNGTAAVVAANEGLIRLVGANGKETRSKRLFHGADHVGIAEDGEQVVVVSKRGDVTILGRVGAVAGQDPWHVNLGCVAHRPVLSNERIAIPTFDGVHAFGPDGSEAGLYDIGSPVLRAHFGNEGATLLVSDAKNRLMILEVASGETLWHVQLEDEPRDVSFSWDGATIVVIDRAGRAVRFAMGDDRDLVASAPAITHGSAHSGSHAAAPNASPRAGARGPTVFLEVARDVPRAEPRVRWRVKTPGSSSVSLQVLEGGHGVAMLDRASGVLSLWDGAREPVWSSDGAGSGARLVCARAGAPIVVVSPRSISFHSVASGELATAPVATREIAVAADGGAVLVASAVDRLHLFDGAGNPLWDVPAPGVRAVGVSASGMELAIAFADGRLSLHARATNAQIPLKPSAPVVELAHLDDGLVFATGSGKVGFAMADGRITFEAALPSGRPVGALAAIDKRTVLVFDLDGNVFRLEPGPWRLTPAGEAPAEDAARQHAVDPMDHLLEFRYDSKEIGCLDAASGTLLWRRALPETPRAVSVTADGSCLAAHVSGELVLYDLSPADRKPEAGPRFLEL